MFEWMYEQYKKSWLKKRVNRLYHILEAMDASSEESNNDMVYGLRSFKQDLMELYMSYFDEIGKRKVDDLFSDATEVALDAATSNKSNDLVLSILENGAKVISNHGSMWYKRLLDYTMKLVPVANSKVTGDFFKVSSEMYAPKQESRLEDLFNSTKNLSLQSNEVAYMFLEKIPELNDLIFKQYKTLKDFSDSLKNLLEVKEGEKEREAIAVKLLENLKKMVDALAEKGYGVKEMVQYADFAASKHNVLGYYFVEEGYKFLKHVNDESLKAIIEDAKDLLKVDSFALDLLDKMGHRPDIDIMTEESLSTKYLNALYNVIDQGLVEKNVKKYSKNLKSIVSTLTNKHSKRLAELYLDNLERIERSVRDNEAFVNLLLGYAQQDKSEDLDFVKEWLDYTLNPNDELIQGLGIYKPELLDKKFTKEQELREEKQEDRVVEKDSEVDQELSKENNSIQEAKEQLDNIADLVKEDEMRNELNSNFSDPASGAV